MKLEANIILAAFKSVVEDQCADCHVQLLGLVGSDYDKDLLSIAKTLEEVAAGIRKAVE